MRSTGSKLRLDIRLNGADMSIQVAPSQTLAELVREELSLTGTKVSCEEGICGSCTVLVDGLPVSACTTLAYEARGKDVLTIEGLEDTAGELHPLQRAFIEEFAFQCGFCTPGMIMAAKALLDDNPEADDAAIISYLDGNICRCTGYLPITRAVKRAQTLIGRGT